MEPAPPGGPAVAGRSPWALAGRRLARNRIALGGLALLVVIVVVSFAAPIY
ncbi:MAG: ABC transporter permease, partial [Gaiellales bacterium]